METCLWAKRFILQPIEKEPLMRTHYLSRWIEVFFLMLFPMSCCHSPAQTSTATPKAAVSASAEATARKGIGLNEFCDPLGTTYQHGTPLAGGAAGKVLSRDEYLRAKGFNSYCDELGRIYSGGGPLFDEATGKKEPLEHHLQSKKWVRGLNTYCDPVDTVYMGGTPLFNERTGESKSRGDYLKSRGLNEFCDPLGVTYPNGEPAVLAPSDEGKGLSKYLSNKVRIVH
jgi:hypothetical protein